MRFLLKNFTFRQYVRYIRRQNKHVQHVHAFAFAGIITSLLAGVILYTDYGFWHERYVAEDALMVEEQAFDPESPGESLGRFFAEVKSRFGSIKDPGTPFLEGRETYKKE